MKNKLTVSLIGSAVALAVVAALWAPANTFAQSKGAQLLTSPPASSPAPAAAPAMSMACPACKNEVTTRTDSTVRGAVKPTVIVAKHLCGGCDTTVTTVGTGKAATTAASHTCSMGGAKPVSCCN